MKPLKISDSLGVAVCFYYETLLPYLRDEFHYHPYEVDIKPLPEFSADNGTHTSQRRGIFFNEPSVHIDLENQGGRWLPVAVTLSNASGAPINNTTFVAFPSMKMKEDLRVDIYYCLSRYENGLKNLCERVIPSDIFPPLKKTWEGIIADTAVKLLQEMILTFRHR